MHFQIFLPNGRGQDPAQLVDVGLADFVAGAEFMDASDGPANGRGTIVAWRRPGQARMGHQPIEQTWVSARPRDDLAAGRYWIGFWNDSPLNPKDVARPYPQAGERVTLGDGQEWMLPVARQLEADLILADDGTWRFDIQRRFHAFFLDYQKWFHFFGNMSEGDTFMYDDGADFILSALRINYRITGEVASHLRLFTQKTVLAAFLAVLGIPHDLPIEPSA